jgi:hypothetical protein
MAQNFSRKHFSRTANNIEESLNLIDETQTRKFVILKINENELFIKTLKECRLDEMLRVEENCYFICRGKIIKEKEIFKIGNYTVFKIWRLIGGFEGDYDSTDDEEEN